MRKLFLIGALFVTPLVQATTTTIDAPSGLVGKNALSSSYAYLWTAPVAAQDITSATITFTGVTRTGSGHGNSINVDFGSFLGMAVGQNSVPAAGGFSKIKDKDAGDAFSANVTAGKATTLGSQNFPSLKKPQTWSYTFTADQLVALNNYIGSGNWGFEIDPDGKFTVGGIAFSYTTEITGSRPVGVVATVPDSMTTFGVLGASFLGLMIFRRRLSFN